MPDKKTWNERLVECLTLRQMNKAELARQCDVSRATVQDWCNGQISNPKLEHFFKMCDVLRINLRWLALGSGERDADTRQRAYSELILRIADAVSEKPVEFQAFILEIVSGGSSGNPTNATDWPLAK